FSDFEPFQIHQGVGVAQRDHLSQERWTSLKKLCQRAFANRHSAGYCTLTRPKAVFFDMDATVIEEESVVELARLKGLEEPVNRVTEEAMAGKLDFEQALRARVKLLAGIATEDVMQVAERL